MKQEIQQPKKCKDCKQPVGAYLHTNHAWVVTECVMAPKSKPAEDLGVSDNHNNNIELNLGERSTCIGVTRQRRRPPRCVQDTRNDYPS